MPITKNKTFQSINYTAKMNWKVLCTILKKLEKWMEKKDNTETCFGLCFRRKLKKVGLNHGTLNLRIKEELKRIFLRNYWRRFHFSQPYCVHVLPWQLLLLLALATHNLKRFINFKVYTVQAIRSLTRTKFARSRSLSREAVRFRANEYEIRDAKSQANSCDLMRT